MAAAAVFALSAGDASAQTSPPPPCTDGIFRDFDFWVGEWDVFNPSGAKVGRNLISREENGCLLVERWAGASGSTGQSFTFVDRAAGMWRQVWVSAGLTLDIAGALNESGEMVLEGEAAFGGPAGAKISRFRGVWTKLDDGGVRQHFQQYDSETERWVDWFIGNYTKAQSKD